MQATVLTPDELTQEDIDSLWNQNVCMDDWDYIVFAPEDSITPVEYEDHEYEYDPHFPKDWRMMVKVSISKIRYTQNEYVFDRILVGCCSNSWYRAEFRGQVYAIGIAYHS